MSYERELHQAMVRYTLIMLGIFFGVIFALAVIDYFYKAEGYSIMTVGDISCSHASLQTMTNAIAYLQEHQVDRFVFLGDAQYKHSFEKCTEQFLKEVQNYTDLRFVVGDHDKQWPVFIWIDKVEDLTMIGLDTNVAWDETSALYKAVNIMLADPGKKIIFMHKNVIDACNADNPSTKKMCGFFELYQPLFLKHDVKCVVSGHQHKLILYEENDICYAVYGMGGAEPFAEFTPRDAIVQSDERGFVIIHDGIHTFFPN